MKMFKILPMLIIVPLYAWGAGRVSANRVSRANARVNIGKGGSAMGDPIMMSAAGDPIMMSNNQSSGGGKRNVKKNSAGDTELQYDFSDFELDNSVKKQINATVSGKIVNGKANLGDTEIKQIGDIVSAQVLKDKGVTKVNLSDDVKKQIGEIVSGQVIKDGGGLQFELSDVAKKQIGDLSLGLVEVKPINIKPIDVKPGDLSSGGGCRDAYRECMDSFCLLDENQGERCACSDNINRAKSKLQEVLDIQAEADKLFTEGVEREELGVKAKLVFTEETAGNTKVSGASFMNWLYGKQSDEGEVGEDTEIGEELYSMAAGYCADELKACGSKADMEESLYSRMITQDCKNYDAYLKDQKANAESNKKIAESAVRNARLKKLDETNKYNRGECLLAYRSCIADKGGCGVNFENCLDAKLLQRRANACEDILDQCDAVRNYVVQDWAEESKMVLSEAEKYADLHIGEVCKAKVTNCIEEVCATATDTACLSNVDLAAEMCPIIKECDEKIAGYKDSITERLAELRTKFCQNDFNKCLQDKCGIDFTAPECLGKSPKEIADTMCPQKMFVSCKNEDSVLFTAIVSASLMKMDYQMLNGCVNYFDAKLSQVCGTDMKCLPIVSEATEFDTVAKGDRKAVITSSDSAVEEFFKQFEQDITATACQSIQGGTGQDVFNSAKILAKMAAEDRNIRAFNERIAELSRKESLEEAKTNCETTYTPETPDKSKSNYMYIKSVHFEPSLRNCRVCRVQQVCEEGGESKATSALKSAAGGLAGGAGAGAMAGGWGALIGGVVGGVGGGLLGMASGGKKKFCQEVESCTDENF